MTPRFVITDGTTEINLLAPIGQPGFRIASWRPNIPFYKGGGTFQESSLSWGRQLVDKQFEDTIDSFDIKVNETNQDGVIFQMQELRRLLEKASAYWVTDWQDEPVWLEARASEETNTRYALISVGRIPEDENPFAQPFLQPDCAAVMNGLTLVVEHKSWTENQPGTGTATQISGTDEYCIVTPLSFDGVDDEVDCGSPAGLDDLPDNAVAGKGIIVVDGWIRPDSYGEGNNGRIADKTEWRFRLDNAAGLAARIDCAAQNATATSGLDEFTVDGLWHYVLMAYDETGGITPAARTIYLNIDGVWVNSYVTQQASIGNYVSDAAQNLIVGNNAGGTFTFDGDIGWIRVRDALPTGVVVNTDFTAPARCPRPDVDANTQGQYIWEGEGATTGNEGAAGGNGAITGALWDEDEACCLTYGRAATTADEVYFADHHNMANLTHIYVDDGAVFGPNLLGSALPYNLLPAAPAVNDAVYFGIDTTVLNSGPFTNTVFDLATGRSGFTGQWESWNGGAWAVLLATEFTDRTVTLSTTGVNPFTFDLSTFHVPVAVNGITAFWLRYRVTAAPGPFTIPQQQNRDVYTITWPYVEVASTEVLGDILALARMVIKPHLEYSADPESIDRFFIFGTRSVSRGERFSAYLNCADEQNDSDITVSLGANTAFSTGTTSPSGRWATYAPLGVEAMATRVQFVIASPLTQEYYGRFRVYLRIRANTLLQFFSVQLRFISSSGGETITSPSIPASISTPTFPVQLSIMDFGVITLQGTSQLEDTDSIDTITIQIQAAAAGVTADDLEMIDLVLIPVDEYAAQISTPWAQTGVQLTEQMNIDSILYPKGPKPRAFKSNKTTGFVSGFWRRVATGDFVLQSNSRQRIWFLTGGFDSSDVLICYYEQTYSLQLFTQQRYLSMRGAR